MSIPNTRQSTIDPLSNVYKYLSVKVWNSVFIYETSPAPLFYTLQASEAAELVFSVTLWTFYFMFSFLFSFPWQYHCTRKVIGGELQERLIPVPYSKTSTDQAVRFFKISPVSKENNSLTFTLIIYLIYDLFFDLFLCSFMSNTLYSVSKPYSCLYSHCCIVFIYWPIV